MTPEQRLNASTGLKLTYFRSYCAQWRLTNKNFLQERYDLNRGISKEICKWDDLDGKATIAHERIWDIELLRLSGKVRHYLRMTYNGSSR